MSSIKQRLLEAIEKTPEPLLEQTLVFLEFLTTREEIVTDVYPDAASVSILDEDYLEDESDTSILAGLRQSLQEFQDGKTIPLANLWDGIDAQ